MNSSSGFCVWGGGGGSYLKCVPPPPPPPLPQHMEYKRLDLLSVSAFQNNDQANKGVVIKYIPLTKAYKHMAVIAISYFLKVLGARQKTLATGMFITPIIFIFPNVRGCFSPTKTAFLKIIQMKKIVRGLACIMHLFSPSIILCPSRSNRLNIMIASSIYRLLYITGNASVSKTDRISGSTFLTLSVCNIK